MNYSPILVVVILLALATSFTLVISFGLRTRKRSLAKNLELKASDVWSQIEDADFEFSGLLYGVWQDFSATRMGMIVKDCRDHQVGEIRYRPAARQGWISIDTADETFECDVLPTPIQSISLRALTNGSPSLCDFTRLTGGTYRFDTKSFGVLESTPPVGLHLAPVFEYTLNGVPSALVATLAEDSITDACSFCRNTFRYNYACSFSPFTAKGPSQLSICVSAW